MPAFVGPVQVANISGGVLQFGDALAISPRSATKTLTGSGSSNTGFAIVTASGLNFNNTLDVNGLDQPIADNN
jgi:spore germination protein PF